MAKGDGKTNRFGVKHKGWKEPRLRMQLTCTGGCLGDKQEPVDSAQHPITHATFVKMTKSQRWLQHVITARLSHKSLQSTTLLETILQKMMAPSDHGYGPPPEDDRMENLDYDADDDSPPDANASIARAPVRRIPMNTIIDLAMPQVCPTAQVRPDGVMRTIKLWHRGKRCVWLAQEDIEWAVCYMRVELDTMGVAPLDEDDDHEPARDDSGDHNPDSQMPRVRWDFERHAWEITKPGEAPTFFGIQDIQASDIPADHGASSVHAYLQTLSYEAKKELARQVALRNSS